MKTKDLNLKKKKNSSIIRQTFLINNDKLKFRTL